MSSQQAALESDVAPAQEAQPTRERSRTRARIVTFGLYLLIGLAALLPRVFGLGLFLDSDERNFWLGRSDEWLTALQTGSFADTAISTHPGVTTMWLGSGGILLRRALLDWGVLDAMPFDTMLILMRLPVVLAHVAGILVGYALLRRMLPLHIATLAALLWAADPFVIAYQRILHVDGLSTTFITLSLLAACVYWHHRTHPAYLVLSAVCGALAVLSKSPALAVLPLVGIVWLWAWLAPIQGTEDREQRTGIKRQLAAPLAWGAVFALTIVLAWPAVWAAPLRVYELLRIGVEVEGSSPHVVGNFFLGEATEAPDPRFYPAVLALRTTPITLLGLLLLPLVWRRAPEWSPTRRDLVVLAAFVILFVLAMSLFPKKLNRYAVPTFPALNVLAAVGLAWTGERVGRLLWQARPLRALNAALVGFVGVLALLNALWWHPYYVVAFNQTLGGAPVGARTFLLGDGEGLKQAADWLHQQPNITGVTIASTMINSFQPWLDDGVQAVSPDEQLSEQVGYVLVYLRHTQRGPLRSPFDQFYPHATPAHTVTIHGIDYAWIYAIPSPIAQRTDVQFGEDITLRGYEIDTSALRSTGMLSLTTQWWADAPLEQNYLMFAHVLTEDGQRIGQTDAPPGGPAAPTVAWEPGRAVTWEHPVPVRRDLPPGDYWLALGLYGVEDTTRLPVAADLPPGAPAAGGDALLLRMTVTNE